MLSLNSGEHKTLISSPSTASSSQENAARAATILVGNERAAPNPQSSGAEIARKRRARSPAQVPGPARPGWYTPAKIIILPVFATNEYPMTYNFTCGKLPASKNTTYSLSDISKNRVLAAAHNGARRRCPGALKDGVKVGRAGLGHRRRNMRFPAAAAGRCASSL